MSYPEQITLSVFSVPEMLVRIVTPSMWLPFDKFTVTGTKTVSLKNLEKIEDSTSNRVSQPEVTTECATLE